MADQELNFVWDDGFWTTSAMLPSWGDVPVNIVFAPEGRGDEPLIPQEKGLVHWVVQHEALLSGALLAALLEKYPSLQGTYECNINESAEYMPALVTCEQLRQLIDLQSVMVHQVSKAGRPYVGFEFACPWDEEHGLGGLMHGERVVQIGGADTAILLWIAEADAEKP